MTVTAKIEVCAELDDGGFWPGQWNDGYIEKPEIERTLACET